MGVLFISHSSLDNERAIAVRDWLRGQGWNDVFLDLDPVQGLAPGQHWQEELKRAGENCAAVLVLVSPNWASSTWCQVEFLLADQLGKRIFPIIIAPTSLHTLPSQLTGKLQFADISTPESEAEGFQRLAIGLRRAGLTPKSFEWPPPDEPNRAVYRGLQSLDIQDAAIFFGRDAAITRGLDDLRRLRDGAPERMLVILGASGAGKSSFLKAGLLARLKRDEENFLVLPAVRPERAAVSGAQGLLASISAAAGRQISQVEDVAAIVEVFEALRAPIVDRMQRSAGNEAEPLALKAPTIIIPIDQAEELFSSENVERPQFCEALAQIMAADANVAVVITIRSDSFQALQTDAALASVAKLLLSLPPIAAGSFQEIIEGPARLARPPLSIDPALTQQLLADLDAADALPLLAFALERLQSRAAGGKLTLQDYTEGLGGLSGAVQAAVASVLGDAAKPADLAGARALFVPALVQVDQDGVKRRAARRQDLSPVSQRLADSFIRERLLVSGVRAVDGKDVEFIELAHEAILRQWPALAGWIAEEGDALRTLSDVRVAAREWSLRANRRKAAASWLAHRQERLKEAEAVLRRKDLEAAIDTGMREYLVACRKDEKKRRRTFLGFLLRIAGLAALLLFIVGLVLAIMAPRPDETLPRETSPTASESDVAAPPSRDESLTSSLGAAADAQTRARLSGDFEAVGLDPRWAAQLFADGAKIQYGHNDMHTLANVRRNYFERGVTVTVEGGAMIVIRQGACRLLNGVETDYEAFYFSHGLTANGCAQRGLSPWPLGVDGSTRWELPALTYQGYDE